jgi:single-strand DNA-binding protein
MFSLNRIQLIGYLTQPVELRQTPSGQSVADLNIAVPYSFKAESGEQLSGQSFHSVTAWGGMAEVAAQYMKPGAQVFLSGRLQTDTWEDEQSGEKRSKTRIVAMDMILLDPRTGQLELPKSAAKITSALNRADVIGNTTRDPEMRTTSGGQNVLTIGVATNERWKDKATGEDKERTEFHNVVLWGELATLTAAHLKKGMRVHVSGRVQTRSWETKQGTKRTTTEIIADSLSLLGVKNTDIAYSSETRAARMAMQRSGKGEKEPSESSPPPSDDLGVPEIKYESEVKVEDLPF